MKKTSQMHQFILLPFKLSYITWLFVLKAQIHVSQRRKLKKTRFRQVYLKLYPWLRTDVVGSDPKQHLFPRCHFLSDCSRDSICVALSPWDTCIDQLNTRPPTCETCLWSDVSPPARTDKYQGRTKNLPLISALTPMDTASSGPSTLFFCGNPCPWLQRAQAQGVLCGLVWLWLSVALNTGSSQGEWQGLYSSPIRMNETPPPNTTTFCHHHSHDTRGKDAEA